MPHDLHERGYALGVQEALLVPLTTHEARRFLNGMEPDDLVPRDVLSGEWAGESYAELGITDDGQDYESGYRAGWEDTLFDRCSDLLS